MLALMVTSEGQPVGYELFPGNTWEGHTLKVAIKALEKRFNITRIMVVADADMLSKDNQKMLGDKGLPYILGYRMKSAPAALRARILGKEGAQPWSGKLGGSIRGAFGQIGSNRSVSVSNPRLPVADDSG